MYPRCQFDLRAALATLPAIGSFEAIAIGL